MRDVIELGLLVLLDPFASVPRPDRVRHADISVRAALLLGDQSAGLHAAFTYPPTRMNEGRAISLSVQDHY
jgi:hypothetical protein